MNETKQATEDSTYGELRERAERLMADGDRAGAAEALERAMECDPFDDDSAVLAAMIRFELGELGVAAELALEAVRRRPFNPSAMNLLGAACLDAGYPDLACKVLRRTVRMAPGFEDANRNLRAAQSRPRQAVRTVSRSSGRQRIPRRRILQLIRGRKPRLSVCLVVGDAGDGFGGCLESLRELAAEIIVIDVTAEGLNPATLVDSGIIALRGPQHDAATALNLGLQRASGDWVLVPRPGERLPREALPALRRDLASRSTLFSLLETRSPDGDGRAREIRLFRNAPGARYSGRVLAKAHPSLEKLAKAWGLGRREGAAHLVADPVASPSPRSVLERETAVQAADADLRLAPDDTTAWLQRAWLDAEAGRPEVALARLAGRPDRCRAGDIDAEELATLEARCLWRLERYPELAKRLEHYHGRYPESVNTLFLQGLAARALGDPATAASLLRRCLDDPPRTSFVPKLPEIQGAGLPNVLGAALLDLGELDDAEAAFGESLGREPGNVEARMGLLGLRLARGQLQPLLEGLDELIADHGDQSRVWSLGAMLLARVPQLAPTAELLLEEACRRFPEETSLGRRLGEARLRCGHPRRALEAWSGLAPQTPAEQGARFAACLGGGLELPEVAERLRPDVEREVLQWLQQWLACSALETLDRALVEIRRAEDRLPGLPGLTAAWLRQIGQTEAAARIRVEA